MANVIPGHQVDMSDFEELAPNAIPAQHVNMADFEEVQPEQHGALYNTGKAVMDGIGWLGNQYERYVTAPTRAAISGSHPITDFAHQFGDDPAKAPTGEDIAKKLGITSTPVADLEGDLPNYPDIGFEMPINPNLFKNITKSQAAGAVVNAAADPLVYAPLGTIARGAGSAVKGAAGTALDATGKALSLGAEAIDGATGTGLAGGLVNRGGKTLDFLANSAKSGNDALGKIFNPKQAADYPELLEIAKRNGVDVSNLPESVEFGRGTFLDSASRARREGVIGEPYMERFKEGQHQLQGAVDKQVARMGGGTAPLAEREAGADLRQGFQKGVDKVWKDIDLTYDSVQKYAPGLQIDRNAMAAVDSKLGGLERKAQALVDRGIDSADQAQGKYLLNAIQQFRNGNGSFKQGVEALRSIGRKAFGSQIDGQIPHDVNAMRDLYFTLEPALNKTIEKHVNPDFAREITANNSKIHQLYQDESQVGHILGNKDVAPEVAFQRAIMNGDSDQIAVLKRLLPPEVFNRQRAAFVNNLVKREADGSMSLPNLFSALRNKRGQLEYLFQDAPEQMKELQDILRLADRFGKPVLSTSGTGASNVFHHIKDSFKSGVANDVLIESLKDKARAIPTTAAPSEARSPIFMLGKAGQVTGGQGGQMQGLASDADQAPNSALLEQVRKNPKILDEIKNPRLRAQIKDFLERDPAGQRNIVDEAGARSQFIQGN
jgi:hypothetical protein